MKKLFAILLTVATLFTLTALASFAGTNGENRFLNNSAALNPQASFDVLKTETAPTIDGTFNAAEWAPFLVHSVTSVADNTCHFRDIQNEVEDAVWESEVFTPFDIYASHDGTNFYMCVVVHDTDFAPKATGVNVQGDSIELKLNTYARTIGFDNDGDCYLPYAWAGEAAAAHDDVNDQTVYEVSMVLANIGATGTSLTARVCVFYGSTIYDNIADANNLQIGRAYFAYGGTTGNNHTFNLSNEIGVYVPQTAEYASALVFAAMTLTIAAAAVLVGVNAKKRNH